jgi:hypothetical protein
MAEALEPLLVRHEQAQDMLGLGATKWRPPVTIRRNFTSGARTSTEMPIVRQTSTILAGKSPIQSRTALAI